jgi:hypothetical protein
MPELSPDESSIAAAGADPGRRKAAAPEAHGAQAFAVILALVDAELAAPKLDARLVILARAAARLTVVEAGEMSLDEAFSDLVPAFLELCGNPVPAMCKSPCINPSFCAASRAEDARRRDQLQKRDERIPGSWDEMSIEALWACFNDRRQTPRVTIEAIWLAIRERGLGALDEPDTKFRLESCDSAARAELARRIELLRG